MDFTGGSTCWNGPSRSLKLQMECGVKEAMLAVDEPSKCTYVARFSTPAACDATAARELRLELSSTGWEEEEQGGAAAAAAEVATQKEEL